MNVGITPSFLFLILIAVPMPEPVVRVNAPQDVEADAGEQMEARISVSVAKGYHLQANPASEDYLVPTRLELKSSNDVRVGKVAYPKGKPYRLSGADKDLQTYDGSFEIGISFRLSRSARPGRTTLQGRLHYQACDSKTCLSPTSLPVALGITIRPTKIKTHRFWSPPASPYLDQVACESINKG